MSIDHVVHLTEDRMATGDLNRGREWTKCSVEIFSIEQGRDETNSCLSIKVELTYNRRWVSSTGVQQSYDRHLILSVRSTIPRLLELRAMTLDRNTLTLNRVQRFVEREIRCELERVRSA